MNNLIPLMIWSLLTFLTMAAQNCAAKDFYINNNSQTYFYLNGTSGNVGIGSLVPGQLLDVQGTVRALNFSGNGSALSGLSFSGWTQAGTNVYTLSPNNVGIGTSDTSHGSLLVTGGNVGIGTTNPQGGLVVLNGNVGIGTWAPANSLDVVGGNLGIGTAYSLVGIGTTSTILTLRTDTGSIYLGYQAGASTTAGSLTNAAVGYEALYNNTAGSQNVAMGYEAIYINATGGANNAFGYEALYNDTASNNVAMGYEALYTNSAGSDNVAMGYEALYTNSTGSSNVALGYEALYNDTGSENAAFGYEALYNQTTGIYNIAVGYEALYGLTGSNSHNTAIGYNSGYYISDGSTLLNSPNNSTFLGDSTMALANGDSNETVIGYGAIGNGSNSVTLGNTSVTLTVLQGNVGIGTVVPGSGLDVSKVELRNAPSAPAYTSTDLICDKVATIGGYTCSSSTGTTEKYFANAVAAIPGAAASNTLDGTHYALDINSIFDISGDNNTTLTWKLNACSAFSGGACTGRVVLWQSAASAVNATNESTLFNCSIVAGSSAGTLGISCNGGYFSSSTAQTSVVTSVPNSSANWVIVWSLTYGTGTEVDAANQVGSIKEYVY